jgi:sigma-B regulation protein RsbU (phosphoserine phosphatase)
LATTSDSFLRGQLEERRRTLETAIAATPASEQISHLLREVDAALERMNRGEFGICESCHDSIEKDRLIADPLVRFCIDHLNNAEQRALERDLELAARIQKALLPPSNLRASGWQIHSHYEPAGVVSGDYCDIIQPADGDLYFLLGDVSGKGVAASMLMSHLNAIFRSLATTHQPLDQLMALANRVFCESTMAGQYATLVCGRASRDGEIHLSSAGHCPPLVLRDGTAVAIEATGLPLGMFCAGEYAVVDYKLKAGESLFLYTDGVTERPNSSQVEYGLDRLSKFLAGRPGLGPDALASACLADLHQHSNGAHKVDDLTIMVIQREA